VSVEIAPLDLADGPTAEALVALQRASYRVEADLLGTDDLPPLRERAADLAASGETFLGSRLDGRLVGALSWKRGADGAVDIHRLVVAPDAFRRGVASALLDALEALAPGAPTLVATGVKNAPARALYERHGFRAVRERVVGAGVQIVELQRP
jgi:ribosomal protein S18 acetylase RimI-like enzyme